ncbi:hypothetical protein [Streptomyces fulvoviolaceus]|uniref:hypothetical protein n=1 Tax=Streptomyces fulvoviolaceus TaxID=285535 RepID=UPI000B2E799E|nr:hypothetical protein [Streptomyces fulvoviolaceus]
MTARGGRVRRGERRGRCRLHTALVDTLDKRDEDAVMWLVAERDGTAVDLD